METKKCRRCAETIKKDAKVCKHCKSDIRLWHFRHPILATILFIFGLIVLTTIVSEPSNVSTSTTDEPSLELMSMNVYTEYNYHYITGEVKNNGTESLEDIMAVGSFYDEDGNFVKSEDALIDYRPLLPGQTSPFTVMASYNPSISRGVISFTTLWGNSINYIDARK